MERLTVGSLFAGVGGFDIAAERAGMDVLWQSEYDKKASAVLDHHWPGLNLGDIHDIRIRLDTDRGDTGEGTVADTTSRVESGNPKPAGSDTTGGTDDGTRTAPAVDVLCGGFPCQDYSVAGNREGLAGDRGALWWEYARLIDEGRPTWVVAENVPGLLSSAGGRDFAVIVDSLVERGYGVCWAVLDAQYFGVAQRRRRVFIVGHSSGRPRPEIFALGEGLYGHPAPSRQTGQNTTAATGSSPFSSSGRDTTGSLTTAFDSKNYSNLQEVSAGSLVAAFHQNQRNEINESVELGFSLTLGGGKPGQGYSAVRRLTPLECERLQGFPDGWTDTPGNTDSSRYKQMGNAVAVPVVEWIMRRIADAG